MFYPDNLTLPRTVGRGFYVFPNTMAHRYLRYVNIYNRNGFFRMRNSKKKPQSGFFHGMEAAAQNLSMTDAPEKAKGVNL